MAASSTDSQVVVPPPHPIAVGVDRLVHRLSDIEQCASLLIPALEREQNAQVDRFEARAKEIDSFIALPRDTSLDVTLTTASYDFVIAIRRFRQSDLERALSTGLFLGIFSAYDGFVGDLLYALFRRREDLLKALNHTFTVADLLDKPDVDALKTLTVEKEVDALRRQSYPDQFGRLSNLFGLQLTQTSRWPDFVEASQRRNLLAHCDGIVSAQYLQVSRSAGAAIPPEVTVGTRLHAPVTYVTQVCRLVMEIAAKLAHTLWRKLLPDELESADQHLHQLAFEALQRQEWRWAATLGEFAVGQKRFASDLNRRIAIVNRAIALQFGGDSRAAIELLDRQDWSACLPVFRLACAVLRGQDSEAAGTMEAIGKSGEHLEEACYHTWPLFRRFRGTPEFQSAYQKVYGYPFTAELRRTLSKEETEISEARNQLSEQSQTSPLGDSEPAGADDDDALAGHDVARVSAGLLNLGEPSSALPQATQGSHLSVAHSPSATPQACEVPVPVSTPPATPLPGGTRH